MRLPLPPHTGKLPALLRHARACPRLGNCCRVIQLFALLALAMLAAQWLAVALMHAADVLQTVIGDLLADH